METSGFVAEVANTDDPSCHVCGSIMFKYLRVINPAPKFVPTIIYRCVSCGTTTLPEFHKVTTDRDLNLIELIQIWESRDEYLSLTEMSKLINCLIAENEEIKKVKTNLYRASIGEVWNWQDDGLDHLETITCPILITPTDLKKLINQKETKAADKGCYTLANGECISKNCMHTESSKDAPNKRLEVEKKQNPFELLGHLPYCIFWGKHNIPCDCNWKGLPREAGEYIKYLVKLTGSIADEVWKVDKDLSNQLHQLRRNIEALRFVEKEPKSTTMLEQAQKLKDGTKERTDDNTGRKALTNLQLRMTWWGIRCFGEEHMSDKKLRGLRLIEEALEFAQALDIPLFKIIKLVTYVYERIPGTAEKELGGIMVTIMAAASAMNLSLWDATLAEIVRVESKSTEHFAQRNEIKNNAGFGKV